jgi:hypothetical protein
MGEALIHSLLAMSDEIVGAALAELTGTTSVPADVASAFNGLQQVSHSDVSELRSVGHYPQVQAPNTVTNRYFEFRGRLAIVRS